jgi:hypothetical protein
VQQLCTHREHRRGVASDAVFSVLSAYAIILLLHAVLAVAASAVSAARSSVFRFTVAGMD